MRRTHAGAACGELSHMRVTDPHAGAVAECEEKEMAETTCDELTTTTIPHPRKLGVKLSLRRREEWGQGVFKIWFYFSPSYSGLIGDKLNFFLKFNLFCP